MNKILIIGGANIEYILKSKEDIRKGSKNFVDVEELYGGSGMNYTSRLLAYGEDIIPLLFVGDDSIGENIYEKIVGYKSKQKIQKDKFFVPNLTTPRSTIIVEGNQRTILAQDLNTKNIFRSFIQERLKDIGDIQSLVIGHIHNDRVEINRDKNDLTTTYVIDFFSDKNTLIYANLGSTQLDYGFDFWIEYLKKIDILQLNIHELSSFIKDGKKLSLYELINKIRELNISAVITLDQFGALGILKGHEEFLFVARAITNLSDFVDSTGAGDAFCSGMVSSLGGKKDFSIKEFKKAMGVGRSWASYACKSFGGANECPNKSVIEDFHEKNIKENEVMIYKNENIRDILALLDSMLKRD
ncbi:MAG: carbohydrate kinase family protein [Epsilonproteobacteria bacterium]|nr:carbohydrate kinase family protein [Campylobacterota bacterium]